MNNEQKIIDNFFLPLAKNKESLELKNDAAFFQKNKMVVSSDMMIEDRHFDKSYDPLILSKKLLRINLSDLAAMGATPYGFLLNISIPPKNYKNWLERFCLGLDQDMKKFNVKLFGGDLSSSPKTFLSLTIFGHVKKKIHRKINIIDGSEIYISDTIGNAGVGLKIKNNDKKFKFLNKSQKDYFLNCLYYPNPKIKLGNSLLGIADFCTDISDGFLNEINHISSFSDCETNIFLEDIPISDDMKDIAILFKNKKKFWEFVLNNGEDYQLLFSVRKSKKHLLKKKKIKNIKKIGFFKKGNPKEIRIFDENKNITELSSIGFSHF
jgi:thiamine-monophosphate kinase